jgi:aspartyl protease family protein
MICLQPEHEVGHVRTKITITNPTKQALKSTSEALVDTGATFTVVPSSLAAQLELEPTETRRVRTATGEVTLGLTSAVVRIDGKSASNPVLISDTIDRILVGVITLESLSLSVDPTTGELNEAEALLFGLLTQCGGP